MKKIVPFNNILTFNTDICEITAISLEPDIRITEDLIEGIFYISGEYKITDGEIKREKFNFELPFDIAIGSNYDRDTLIVDIDDFRYDVIERNKLKVNIDVYIDGEIIEPKDSEKNLIDEKNRCIEPEITEDIPISIKEIYNREEVIETEEERLPEFKPKESTIQKEQSEKENNELTSFEDRETSLPQEIEIQKRLDLLEEMLTSNKEEIMKEENSTNINNNENNNENNNIGIFNGFNEFENYVTYRVYRVLENDTLDKIIEKYNTTKEELAKYNNIEDIKAGDKLIIPANDK